jgi:hypothetical protein
VLRVPLLHAYRAGARLIPRPGFVRPSIITYITARSQNWQMEAQGSKALSWDAIIVKGINTKWE